jgi:hypothetical protein
MINEQQCESCQRAGKPKGPMHPSFSFCVKWKRFLRQGPTVAATAPHNKANYWVLKTPGLLTMAIKFDSNPDMLSHMYNTNRSSFSAHLTQGQVVYQCQCNCL